MLEGIICPACENSLEEAELKESLSCPKCKTDLKNRKYLDFLEYLMTNGIVKDLDFFDAEVYSEDIEDLDQTEEEEVNPADFEKKKDTFSLYENEWSGKKMKKSTKNSPSTVNLRAWTRIGKNLTVGNSETFNSL